MAQAAPAETMTMTTSVHTGLPRFDGNLINDMAPARKPINGMIFGVWDILGTNCVVGYG